MKTKVRLTKILSWWLIISMVMEMLPFSVISVFAQDLAGSQPQVTEGTGGSDVTEGTKGTAEGNGDSGTIAAAGDPGSTPGTSGDNSGDNSGDPTGDLDPIPSNEIREKSSGTMVSFFDKDGELVCQKDYTVGDPIEEKLDDGYVWSYNGTPVTTIQSGVNAYYEIKDPSLLTKPSESDLMSANRGSDTSILTLNGDGDGEKAAETWKVTFYNRDARAIKTVEVIQGEPIGDQIPAAIARDGYDPFWSTGSIVAGAQGPEINPDGNKIDSTFVPTGDTTIVPYYEWIVYTVNFYEEDKSTFVTTKTVDFDTNFGINDMPAVPNKAGFSGRWVYSGGDFTNQVKVNTVAEAAESRELSVWAEYDQNVFTVTFKLDDDNTYQTYTYYKGDTLTLPAEPVVAGKEFNSWTADIDGVETTIEGGEKVTSDLEIIAHFDDEYSVKFIVEDDAGQQIEELSQYFRIEGETIGQLPQSPFVSGKVFEKWVIQGTETEVTADTVVKQSMTVVAVFRAVTVYQITAEYFYLNDSGREVIFNTDLHDVEAEELPYEITAPESTKTDENEVSGGPVYYPVKQKITVTADDFNSENKCTIRFQYVKFTAKYNFVYMLKNLSGQDYEQIYKTENVEGVLGSYVTPTVKNFPYANLERAVGATIERTEGQDLYVYYTRKNFQLTYDTQGGSYVGGVTVPYGTQQPVSSTVPTRSGYTFGGWYLDEGKTEPAGDRVTVTGNTTLYAKWTGNTVDFTIIYMFEKYNDAGTQSAFVKDNSGTGRGRVGDTIYANDSSIPDKSKKGWEKDTDRNAASSVVITADGSAVLLVYYKLKEYTFTFTINGESSNNRYRMTIKGTTYRGSDKYSFKAKLGQDISADWPNNGNPATIWDNNNGYYFYYWSCQGTSYASKILRVTEALLPNSGTSVPVTGTWRTNNNTVQVNYWLQNANDDGYTKSTLYSQSSPSGYYSPKEISGYTYDHSNNTNSAYNFYYKRHTYQIKYLYETKVLDTISDVKYEADITGNRYNWVPTQQQCGVESDYTWGGWYSDSTLQSPYTFSRMPAGATNGGVALVLYAKWIAPTLEVSFVDGDDPTTVYDTKTVEKHKEVTAPETTPSKPGYTFEGWYTNAGGDDLFDWHTQIVKKTTVYAHWSQKTLSYTVHYVNENNETLAPDKIVENPNFRVNDTISEQAIAISGYRPKLNKQNLTLTGIDEDDVLTFVYVLQPEKTSYTVYYLVADDEEFGSGKTVATKKEVINVPGKTASVIELAAAVDYEALYSAVPELEGVELYPDAVEKTLVLSADPDQNTLTFYYSTYKHATVTVRYQDMEKNPIGSGEVKQILKVGNTFTLDRSPITGWELYSAKVTNGGDAGNDYKITDEVADNGLDFTLTYQKKATITIVDQNKPYDGVALKLPASTSDRLIMDGLVDGDTLGSLTYTYTGCDNTTNDGRLNAGYCTVKPSSAVIYKESGEARGSNYYAIRYISGTLEVTKVTVTIRIEPDRWTSADYNGTEYMAGFTNPSKEQIDNYVMISYPDYKEEYLNAIWETVLTKATYNENAGGFKYYCEKQKDAGEYTYDLGFTEANLPQNDNYSVNLYVRQGLLEILPAELTVTTGNAEKEYDGTPLTNDEATLTGLVAADQGKVTVKATGSQTEVGSSDNTYTINWGGVNPKNYNITENLGTLTVTEASLSVTVNDKTTTYDGSEQTGYTIPDSITGTGSDISTDDYTVTGLAEGDILTVSYTPSKGTHVQTGPYSNGTFGETITYTIKNADDVDVTEYYQRGTFTPGKLTIRPATLTVTTESDEKPYDGTALTADGSISGFVNNETATFTVTGSQTEVGSSSNSYTLVFDQTAVSTDIRQQSQQTTRSLKIWVHWKSLRTRQH